MHKARKNIIIRKANASILTHSISVLQQEDQSETMLSSDKLGWSIALGLIAVVIVTGNALAIAALSTSRKLMRMRTSYFLLNLAVADSLVGALAIPMYIVLLCNHATSYDYQSVYTAVDILSGFASVFTLTAISCERLYAFLRPRESRKRLTSGMHTLFISSVWVLSVIVTIFHLLYRYKVLRFAIFFSIMVSLLTTSIAVMCICYAGIWIKIKLFYLPHRRNYANEKKLAVLLVIVTSIFVITWLPFHLLNIINFFCDLCFMSSLPPNALFFSKFLQYSNSFMNPVVYAVQLPGFLKSLVRLVCQRRRGRFQGDSKKVERVNKVARTKL